MIKKQTVLALSPYMGIYELIVPKDNLLRQMNELVDFSFIYAELVNVYCQNNGRCAIDPVRMFKYLLLKSIFDISDVDVVERSKYDMSFKYFLGMTPEGAITKSYSVTIKHHMHEEQATFQESEYFKEKSKERYKIEAKNSELKHRHGYDVASASGLTGMQLQGATTIFAVNMKRIITLMKEK